MDVNIQISRISRNIGRCHDFTDCRICATCRGLPCHQGGAPRTTKQIAEVTQVPGGYLSKVMQTLSRAGVVNSQRGLRGGFTLVSKPDELSILTIINAIDPILRFPECPLGIPTHGKRLCPLHSRLDQAGQMIEDAFADTTVSELLAVPSRRKPLCRFPTAPVSK